MNIIPSKVKDAISVFLNDKSNIQRKIKILSCYVDNDLINDLSILYDRRIDIEEYISFCISSPSSVNKIYLAFIETDSFKDVQVVPNIIKGYTTIIKPFPVGYNLDDCVPEIYNIIDYIFKLEYIPKEYSNTVLYKYINSLAWYCIVKVLNDLYDLSFNEWEYYVDLIKFNKLDSKYNNESTFTNVIRTMSVNYDIIDLPFEMLNLFEPGSK